MPEGRPIAKDISAIGEPSSERPGVPAPPGAGSDGGGACGGVGGQNSIWQDRRPSQDACPSPHPPPTTLAAPLPGAPRPRTREPEPWSPRRGRSKSLAQLFSSASGQASPSAKRRTGRLKSIGIGSTAPRPPFRTRALNSVDGKGLPGWRPSVRRRHRSPASRPRWAYRPRHPRWQAWPFPAGSGAVSLALARSGA